jgi:hypothetical protein
MAKLIPARMCLIFRAIRGRTRTNGAIRSFEPVGNPALGQIIRRHFDQHFVAGELATILLSAASRRRPTLDNRRFIGHFVTKWNAMLSPLPNSKIGGWQSVAADRLPGSSSK